MSKHFIHVHVDKHSTVYNQFSTVYTNCVHFLYSLMGKGGGNNKGSIRINIQNTVRLQTVSIENPINHIELFNSNVVYKIIIIV